MLLRRQFFISYSFENDLSAEVEATDMVMNIVVAV